MSRVLFLLTDLEYRSYARQATLLADALPRDRFQVEVVCLNPPGPLADSLRRSSIPLHMLAPQRWLNVANWFALNRCIRELQPDIIHVWGLAALRALHRANPFRNFPRLIVSLSPDPRRGQRISWWDRRAIGDRGLIIARCAADRAALVAAGLPADRTHVIPPGVPISSERPDEGFRQRLGIPTGSPLLMHIGKMDEFDRSVDVFWSFDMLRYVKQDAHLANIGDGKLKTRAIGYFATGSEHGDSMHFLDERPDAAATLINADIVLIPPRRTGGTYATLEAMAAGRAVIATRLPHLEALIRDGETGILVPPTDQPALARACLRLLEDANRRAMLGDAARAEVEQHFSITRMAQRFGQAYESGAMEG